MGQYVIKMNNSTKQLICTNKINLRQYESLVDKLSFLVEYQYTEDIDLRDFSVQLRWIDPSNVAHVDLLEKEEDIYKENFQRYFLPVESPLSRYAGEIKMYLVFTYADEETKKRYKLESEEIYIEISNVKDYYAVMPNESFDYIDQKVDELKAMVEQLNASVEIFEKTKADNIAINEDGDLQLQANSEFIGNAVAVVTPGTIDDVDSIHDGVINLDEVYEEVSL